MNPRRFAGLYFLGLGLTLGLVAGINYQVDPDHYFRVSPEALAADRLARGEPVARKRLNDRYLRPEEIDRLSARPDIVLLGTERFAFVNSSAASGRRFLNLSLPGASLEDMLALIHRLYARDRLPPTLWLGLDPASFESTQRPDGFDALEADYYAMIGALGLDPNARLSQGDRQALATRQLQLISGVYFRRSLAEALRQWKDPGRVEIIPDGSLAGISKGAEPLRWSDRPPSDVADQPALKALAAWLKKQGTRVLYLSVERTRPL